jgi:hypothetical protein
MASRGSVIPLFIQQIKEGKPIYEYSGFHGMGKRMVSI